MMAKDINQPINGFVINTCKEIQKVVLQFHLAVYHLNNMYMYNVSTCQSYCLLVLAKAS